MKQAFVLLGLFLLAVPPSHADVKVKNNTAVSQTFEAAGTQWVILPGQSASMTDIQFEHPAVQRLIRSGKLEQEKQGLSVNYCNSDEADEYCFMDLAVEKKDGTYCAYIETWPSQKECLYYVDRKRKLTERDCLGFDPGSDSRKQCEDYVRSGIPSKPDQSYEQSLSLNG